MNYLRHLFNDCRGTSSAEAAVMLPVMALCWAGLFLRFEGIERGLDAAVEARRDVWVASDGGCEEPMPAGVLVGCSSGHKQDWMSTVASIPLIGPLISSVTGIDVEKTATREHEAPPLLGGGKTQIGYSYYLTCNERERPRNFVLAFVLCEQFKTIGLSIDFMVDCPSPPPRPKCN